MAVLKAITSGGERREHDFYPTPPEATRALIPHIEGWKGDPVWEPAAGDGAISEVLRAAGFEVVSSDLVDRGYCPAGVNFLTSPALAGQIVTNPPFNLAARFIFAAHLMGVERMAMLLKTDFWSAARRRWLFDLWRPAAILQLTWRLDFTGAGAPHTNCSWFLWDGRPASTRYDLLDRP